MTPNSETLTVMFVDLVGYTKTANKLGRQHLSDLHDIFDNISLEVFAKYHGKVIKKIGDAFLTTFKSPTNAILSGIALQSEFRKYNKTSHPKIPLKIRVAIHSGEVVIKNDDIYGDAVNVTSRIERLTKENDIVFSESVYSIMNKNEIPYLYIGAHRFKGVKHPVKLFKVKKRYDEILRKKRNLVRNVKRSVSNILFLVLFLLILAVIIGSAFYYLFNYSRLF
jgi:adenylate cyclase